MEIGPGTRAIVTGATKGIGLATARALAGRGAAVGLLARNEEDLKDLAAGLPRSEALPADVTDAEATERAIRGFAERSGGLELLVANAGMARYAPFFEQDPEDAERMVATSNSSGERNTSAQWASG